ncbi:MAG: class I SAM-dependent rRNA methyltransferase, partial [Mesorhizobium sp.]
MKPFRDKRRDSRSHQLAKGGAEQAPRATGTASGNRTEPKA